MTTQATAKRTFVRSRKHEFAQHFTKDDGEAREIFIEAHLPLVVSLAKKRLNQGVDFEDLVQEGIIGLITAAEKFDPTLGYRFSTYATWWIRQAMDESLLKHGDTVKKPSNYSSHLKHLLRVTRDLSRTMGREPSVAELSEKADMDQNMVRQLLSLIPGTISLDAPISDSDDSANNFMDVLEDRDSMSPDEESMISQMKVDIEDALGALNDKERKVIELRFGLKSGERMSLREVGRIFGLSPERIRQIEETAIHKLKNHDDRGILKAYLTA